MRRDELGHLKHRDLALPAEDCLQLVVRQDISLVCRILKVVLLNIYPKLFDHFRSRERTLAHDCFKFGRKVKGL